MKSLLLECVDLLTFFDETKVLAGDHNKNRGIEAKKK